MISCHEPAVRNLRTEAPYPPPPASCPNAVLSASPLPPVGHVHDWAVVGTPSPCWVSWPMARVKSALLQGVW